MNKQDNTFRVDAAAPPSEILCRAAKRITQGEVVVFPTRCLYGLGADALNPAAVAAVFDIKQRPPHKPISILITHHTQLQRVVKEIPPVARRLMVRFWPGRITLIFEAARQLVGSLTGGSSKIGVRQVAHPVAAALVQAVGGPITGTSANVSSRPGCSRLECLDSEVARAAAMLLDVGPLQGGTGSTVIDVTVMPPRVLRRGVVPDQVVFKALGLQISD